MVVDFKSSNGNKDYKGVVLEDLLIYIGHPCIKNMFEFDQTSKFIKIFLNKYKKYNAFSAKFPGVITKVI